MDIRLKEDVPVIGNDAWGIIDVPEPGLIVANQNSIDVLGICLSAVYAAEALPTRVHIRLDGRRRSLGPNGQQLKEGTIVGKLVPKDVPTGETNNNESTSVGTKSTSRRKTSSSS